MPFDPSSGALDLILGVAALVTAVTLVRSWKSFWDRDFTASDRRLAMQVGMFLIPPVVVLLHELGHLFAARMLGIRVLAFRYGLFEGSVTVAGRLTAFDSWFIAVAGNLVSLAVGLAMVGVGVLARGWRAPLRYLLVVGGLIELVFTLVAYPLLSATSNFGDWITIYDFQRTPALSGGTAAVHAGLLVGLRQWWRRRGRATLFTLGIGGGLGSRLAELQRAVDTSPRDPDARLALADFYARNGELPLARVTLDDAVAVCGDVPRLHLGRARISMFQGRWSDAVVAARAGLQADPGDDSVRQPLWANLALALTQMERPDHARPAYDHLTSPLADDVRVRYGRGLVRLESGDVERGRADLRAVVESLPEGHLLRLWAEARLHGQPLREFVNPDAPRYERSSAPPPAPLAGV